MMKFIWLCSLALIVMSVIGLMLPDKEPSTEEKLPVVVTTRPAVLATPTTVMTPGVGELPTTDVEGRELPNVTPTICNATVPNPESGVLVPECVEYYGVYGLATKLKTNHRGEACLPPTTDPKTGIIYASQTGRVCDGSPLYRSQDFRDFVLGFEEGVCRETYVDFYLNGYKSQGDLHTWPNNAIDLDVLKHIRDDARRDKLELNRQDLIDDVGFFLFIMKDRGLSCEFDAPKWFSNE